jgi:hypothetical protein
MSLVAIIEMGTSGPIGLPLAPFERLNRIGAFERRRHVFGIRYVADQHMGALILEAFQLFRRAPQDSYLLPILQ